MSTIGTVICGSSSRGVSSTAKAPTSSDAMIRSGVSLESMKKWATLPAGPRLGVIAAPQLDAPETGAPSAIPAGGAAT